MTRKTNGKVVALEPRFRAASVDPDAKRELLQSAVNNALTYGLPGLRERLVGISASLMGLDIDVQDCKTDADTVAEIAVGAAASLSICAERLAHIESAFKAVLAPTQTGSRLVA